MKVLNDFEHMTRITVSREKYTNERKKTFEGSMLKFKRFVAEEYMYTTDYCNSPFRSSINLFNELKTDDVPRILSTFTLSILKSRESLLNNTILCTRVIYKVELPAIFAPTGSLESFPSNTKVV